MNIKKGQRIRINLESFRKELDLNYKLFYKSIPFRMRNNDFYKKQFSALKEKYNSIFSLFEKENPLVTNVNSDGYIDIIFSDKSEASINSKHVIEIVRDVIDEPKIESKKEELKKEELKVDITKKVETKKTETKKNVSKKSSTIFKKKKK